MRRAGASTRFQVSAQRSRLLWSQALLIPRPFDRDGTFRPGSAGAETELERGQRQARQHQQTRRSLSTQLVHGGCARRDPLCETPWHEAPPMADGVVSAPAHQGRCHCARQQDRSHGMGDDDEGRALQGTRCARGVKAITSAIFGGGAGRLGALCVYAWPRRDGRPRGMRTLFLGRPIIEPVGPSPAKGYSSRKALRLRCGQSRRFAPAKDGSFQWRAGRGTVRRPRR